MREKRHGCTMTNCESPSAWFIQLSVPYAETSCSFDRSSTLKKVHASLNSSSWSVLRWVKSASACPYR